MPAPNSLPCWFRQLGSAANSCASEADRLFTHPLEFPVRLKPIAIAAVRSARQPVLGGLRELA
jgi:hypothetical protein